MRELFLELLLAARTEDQNVRFVDSKVELKNKKDELRGFTRIYQFYYKDKVTDTFEFKDNKTVDEDYKRLITEMFIQGTVKYKLNEMLIAERAKVTATKLQQKAIKA